MQGLSPFARGVPSIDSLGLNSIGTVPARASRFVVDIALAS